MTKAETEDHFDFEKAEYAEILRTVYFIHSDYQDEADRYLDYSNNIYELAKGKTLSELGLPDNYLDCVAKDIAIFETGLNYNEVDKLREQWGSL